MTRSYHATLRPLVLLCKLLGMSPVTPTKFPKCYTLGVFAGYTLEVCYILSKATNVVEEIGIYPKAAVLLFCVLMVTLQIVGVANSFLQRRIFGRFVEGISDIDCSVQFGQSYNYKVLSIMFLSGLLRSAATMNTVNIDPLSQVLYYKATLIKSLLKYKATILMGDINARYVGLAEMLDKENCAELARLHFKLRNCTQLLLRSCGAELVVCILASTWNIGFQSYCLYISCTRLDCLETWSHLASPLAWISEEFFEMYRLVKACFDTCQSANRFPILLHELRYTCIADPAFGCEVYQLSLKFLHQKLQLSAVGFFKLDYTLIYSVITAITTYLVIFIQYDLNYQ